MADRANDIEKPVNAERFEAGWGSDVIADMLRRFKIDHIALNPGASYRGLHDSLVNYLGNHDPAIMVCLHEEHAVAIAHGYAKATGRAMAVAVHSNIGLMHATMAIFNAWCDRVPVYILGATGPMDAVRRRPWIEWMHTAKDQAAMIRQYIKWDDQPVSVEAAVEAMLRAWQIAHTPPCGPVYLCFDIALQEDALKAPVIFPDIARFAPGDAPVPSADSIERAADLLVRARRPLILAGRVSRDPEDWQRRLRLAELLDARVVTDLKAGAAFPTNHPLHAGAPGLRLGKAATDRVRQADVILGLDWIDPAGTFQTVLGQVALGASAAYPTFIDCSVDSALHNGWSMDYFALPASDVRLRVEPDVAVKHLLPVVKRRLGSTARQSDWPAAVAAPRATFKASGKISYHAVGDALTRALGGKPATLAKLPLSWPGDALHFRGPLDFMGADGGGGIGGGPGISIGIALGLKGTGRLPVAILSDGDSLMGLTALWSARKYDVPLLVLVANNRSYFNDVRHQDQVARHRGRPPENRGVGQRIDDPAPDLAHLAKGFGWTAEGPIATPGDLDGALARGIAAVERGGCHLIDILIDQGE